MMDDLFDPFDDPDDLLDPTTAAGIVLIAGSGLLDDDRGRTAGDESCSCWCGCQRRVAWGEEECRRCWEGTHSGDR